MLVQVHKAVDSGEFEMKDLGFDLLRELFDPVRASRDEGH